MRCGLIRLVTRRSPYDLKIRRKCLDWSLRNLEKGALNAVADSKVIGRNCAHKSCRILEKSAKKFPNRIRISSDSGRRKVCKTFSFNRFDSPNFTNVCYNPYLGNLDKATRVDSKSKIIALNSVGYRSSKLLMRIKKNSTAAPFKSNNDDFKSRLKSKSQIKIRPKKRLSSIKVFAKGEIYTGGKKMKRYFPNKSSNTLNKNLSSPENMYSIDSTSSPDRNIEDHRDESKRCAVTTWPYDGLDLSDYGQGFLDREVLNHLNETSNISLCGCANCARTLKRYEKKNSKINRLLQNKLTQLYNYCKNKYPFYKISSANYKKQDFDGADYLKRLYSCENADWCHKTLKNPFTHYKKKLSRAVTRCKGSQTVPHDIEESQINTTACKNQMRPATNCRYIDEHQLTNNIEQPTNNRQLEQPRSLGMSKKKDVRLSNGTNIYPNNITDRYKIRDANNNSRILDFEECMIAKYEELNKKLINDFSYFSDKEYGEMTKNVLEEKFESDNGYPANDIGPSTNDQAINKEDSKSVGCANKSRHSEMVETEKNPNLTSFGPLDRFNEFSESNVERYNEKINLIKSGPNFSMYIDSRWKRSLLDDNRVSQTFDVSDPLGASTPIKINRDNRPNLSRYSEINIAIEKVKKKIFDIINEPDVNPSTIRTTCRKCNLNGDNDCRELLLQESDNQKVFLNDFNCVKPKSDITSKCYDNNNNDPDPSGFVGKIHNDIGARRDATSSVHLNEIIRAIKGGKTDRSTEPRKVRASSKIQNKCYETYSTSTFKEIGKTPKKFFNATEPFLSTVHAGNWLNRSHVQFRFMSTNSNNDPPIARGDGKNDMEYINDKEEDFSKDSIGLEVNKDEKIKSTLRNVTIEYGDTGKEVSRSAKYSRLGENYNEKQFSKIEYVNNKTNCQEKLSKKSFDFFSIDNDRRNPNKTEYSANYGIPGVLDRFNSKVADDKNRKAKTGADSEIKRWKVWDSNHWKNEADKWHAEMISKGFFERNADGRRDDVILNESREERKRGSFSNWNGKEALLNNCGRELNCFRNWSDSRPCKKNVFCANVGDLALNSAEKRDKKGKMGCNGEEGIGQQDFEKFFRNQDCGINNLAPQDIPTSTRARSYSQADRNERTRHRNGSDTYSSSFKASDYFLMDNKNTFRTTSGSINVRRASSGRKNSDLKTNIADRLKTMKRIDEIKYTREEKTVSETEELGTLKIKEIYRSGKFDESSYRESPPDYKNYKLNGICSKEVESVMKNRATGDSDVKKHITEEIKVTGTFPDGQKFVQGKLVSIVRPRSKFTALKCQNNDRDRTNSLLKHPLTVQMNYEMVSDGPPLDFIDTVKKRSYLNDKDEPKYKLRNFEKVQLNDEASSKANSPTRTDDESDRNDGDEKLSRGWKKYNPVMESKENKSYDVKLKKVSRIVQPVSEQETNSSVKVSGTPWGAPRNRVYERFSSRNDFESHRESQKEVSPKQQIFSSTREPIENRSVGSRTEQTSSKNAITQDRAGYKNNKKDKSGNITELNKLTVENKQGKPRYINYSDGREPDNVDDKATDGETKYEIDTGDFNNSSGIPEQREKLVVSHFKQYMKLENSKVSPKKDFSLEASMLTVTLEKSGDKIDKNAAEMPTIECVSNQVENELNEMAEPHFIKTGDGVPEMKTGGQKIFGDILKPKDYYLSMLNRRAKNESTPVRNGYDKITLKSQKGEKQDVEPLSNNYCGVKILKARDFIFKNNLKPDRSLKETFENVYLEQISLEPPLQTDLNKMSVSADKLYMDGSHLRKLKGLINGSNPANDDATKMGANLTSCEVNKHPENSTFKETSDDNKRESEPSLKMDEKTTDINNKVESAKKSNENEMKLKDPIQSEELIELPSEKPPNNEEVKALSVETEQGKDSLLKKVLKKITHDKNVKMKSYKIGENETPTTYNSGSKYKEEITTSSETASQDGRGKSDLADGSVEKTGGDGKKQASTSGNDTEQNPQSKMSHMAVDEMSQNKEIQLQNSNVNEEIRSPESIDPTKLSGYNDVTNAQISNSSHSFYSYESTTKPEQSEKDGIQPIDKLSENNTEPNADVSKRTELIDVILSKADEVKTNFSVKAESAPLNDSKRITEDKSDFVNDNARNLEDKSEKLVATSENDSEQKFQPKVNHEVVYEKGQNEEMQLQNIKVNKESAENINPTIVPSNVDATNSKIKNSPHHFYSYDSTAKPKLSEKSESKPLDQLSVNYNEPKVDVIKTELINGNLAKADEVKTDTTAIKLDKKFDMLNTPLTKTEQVNSFKYNKKQEGRTDVNKAPKENEKVNKIDKIAHEVQENLSGGQIKKAIKNESQKKGEHPEEQFEIMSSTYNQYDFTEESNIDNQKEYPDNMRHQRDEELEEQHDFQPKQQGVKMKKVQTTEKNVPVRAFKKFKQFKKKTSSEDAEFEKWDKQATYIKNLRPGFHAMKKIMARHQNYERNEKKYQKLKMLNKITSMNKISNCDCKRKEEWVADMCCSKNEPSEEKATKQESAGHRKRSTSRTRMAKQNRAGKNSSEWPDHLSRKKDSIIKQPQSPKPRWRK